MLLKNAISINSIDKLRDDVVRLNCEPIGPSKNLSNISIEINNNCINVSEKDKLAFVLTLYIEDWGNAGNDYNDYNYVMIGNILSLKDNKIFISFGGLLCNIILAKDLQSRDLIKSMLNDAINVNVLHKVYLGLKYF